MSPAVRRSVPFLLAATLFPGAAFLDGAYPDLSKGRPPLVLDARVGANIRLGEDPDALPATLRGQAEPHIARSVFNADLLLATFQEGRYTDGGAVSCGYGVSRDGGHTWTRALIPNLTTASGGRYVRATDPVAGAGPLGELYLQTLVSLQGAFETAAIVVSRSTDSGTTWSAPATVFASVNPLLAPDKNWLAVNDYAGTPNVGRLVSTWSNFNNTSAGGTTSVALVASFSDDQGATWSAPAAITPPGSQIYQGTQPVFLPDGSLFVAYIEFLASDRVTLFNLQGRLSTNGGRTFPATATRIVDPVNGWDDPAIRDGVFLPSATAARGTGDLFVTYAAVVAGSPRVLVTKSGNRGATWSPPVVVSDQPAGVSVMNPAVAVTPDGRTVSVVFMDKRQAPDGMNYVDHYAALSLDGGATWLPNLRLTEQSSDIRLGPPTPRGIMLGDYLGVVPGLAADQPFVAIWCDTRTGDSDPFIVRFTPAAAGDFRTWSIAHGIRSPTTDTDGDGSLEIMEFANGTNPRRPDAGESLVLRRPDATTLDIAWTQRPAAELPGVQVATDDLRTLPGALLPTGAQPAPLPDSAIPATLPPAGLVWRGVRATIPADRPAGVIRFFTHTTGQPPAREAEFATISTDSRLVNLSTRSRIAPASGPLIVGFVLDGTKAMLVRAAGPALAALGVGDPLADPQFTLNAPAPDLARNNDNWQQGGASPALLGRLGAFPFAAGSLDAALAVTLGAQSYTAVVIGANGGQGIALVEAYDADITPGTSSGARLVNLSTRGAAGPGAESLIAGLVLNGTAPRRVLLRAVGPGLAQLGVTGTIPDPRLTLFRGATEVAANDDWEISRSAGAVAAAAVRVGAFPLAAASLDAALLITLPPGAYTVVVSGADGRTGIALVEVYDAD